MAPKGSSKGMGKAREKMPTLGINQRRSLDQDCIKRVISVHIGGLIQISNVCGVQDEGALGLLLSYNLS